MLNKIILGAALLSATALVAPDVVHARGGGGHGGFHGGGNWHAGKWNGGGKWNAGKWNNGYKYGKWNNGYKYGHWNGYGWGYGGAVAAGAVAAGAAAIAAPYYYNNGCTRNVQVQTPVGLQWQAVNVC